MNLIVAIPSFLIVIVAIEVLAAMRPGVTWWGQFPIWLVLASSAFHTAFDASVQSWSSAGLLWATAGMFWRMRHRLVGEAAAPRPDISGCPCVRPLARVVAWVRRRIGR